MGNVTLGSGAGDSPQYWTYAIGVAAGAVFLSIVLCLMWSARSNNKVPVFLDKTRKSVHLIERELLSPDTVRLRFALPNKTMTLGLPVGKHLKVFGPDHVGSVPGSWNGQPVNSEPDNNQDIARSYTPSFSERGHFDLVIKVYLGGVVERFPDGGKMSQYLEGLAVGDCIAVQGPFGSIEYLGDGQFANGRKRSTKKTQIGLMAGGTGITPMLQVIDAVLREPEQECCVSTLSLLYANQTEDDILVRTQLEALSLAHPGRFKLHYTLDRPPPGWSYSEGFITTEMIEAHLPHPGPETIILMCGPPPMVQYACKNNLEKLGYSKIDQLAF